MLYARVMRKEIRTYWPSVTNDQIDKLKELTGPEWILIRRMCRDNRIGGKEIAEKDLFQSVDKKHINTLKKARDGLIKKQIFLQKPKATTPIYQSDPKFFDKTVMEFANIISGNGELKDELTNDNVDFFKVSDVLQDALNKLYSSRRTELRSYELLPSPNRTGDGELGVIAKLDFICPEKKKVIRQEFEILSPNEIHKNFVQFICGHCGARHHCSSSGKITTI